MVEKPATVTTAPTRVRQIVLSLLVLFYGITYMDRVVIAAAAPSIRAEFGIDAITLGFVFSAFTIAYALFQIPGGWMADRFGPRRVLTAIIIYWSAFTMATALAWNAASLIVIRFMFGTGEAGAFPGATRAFSRWLPSTERGFAQGITHSGARLAAALTPAIVTSIVVVWGWRSAFVVFGLIGILWGIAWYWYYRDRPEDHPHINDAELAVIRGTNAPVSAMPGGHGHAPKAAATGSKVPWRIILRSSNMWMICAMYFCYVYTLWIFLTWMPTYLVENRGFSLMASGLFAGLPLL